MSERVDSSQPVEEPPSPEDEPTARTSTPVHVPVPDLEIRITVETQAGETFLSYLLHSSSHKPGGFHYRTIRGQPMRALPQDYHNALLWEIGHLRDGSRVDGSLAHEGDIPRELDALGHKLYRELFPPEMRACYRTFRKRVRSLLITSDEPWIPWELIKPYDDEGPDLIDDHFLCIRFELTRWLSGDLPPSPILGISRLASFDAGEAVPRSRLPSAKKEHAWVRNLAQKHAGVEDQSPERATYAAVREALKQGELDLIHFVGHGAFESQDPDLSSFHLFEGRLRPIDLHGEIQTHVKSRRPLVFLNACEVGQQSFALTGLGGWAPRWVRDCGCSVFVAPIWPVDDDLAHDFALTFYGALEAGKTFGQATREARLKVLRTAPSRLTWLAFTTYAHPNGRWVFGRRSPQVDDPEPVDLSVTSAVERDHTATVTQRGAPRSRALSTPRTTRWLAALCATLALAMASWLFGPEPTRVDPAERTDQLGASRPEASESEGATGAGGSEGAGRTGSDEASTAPTEAQPVVPRDSIAVLGETVRLRVVSGSSLPLSRRALETELVRGLKDRIGDHHGLLSAATCVVALDFGTPSPSDGETGSCAFEVGYELLIDGAVTETDLFYVMKSGFSQRAACVAAARALGAKAGERVLVRC